MSVKFLRPSFFITNLRSDTFWFRRISVIKKRKETNPFIQLGIKINNKQINNNYEILDIFSTLSSSFLCNILSEGWGLSFSTTSSIFLSRYLLIPLDSLALIMSCEFSILQLVFPQVFSQFQVQFTTLGPPPQCCKLNLKFGDFLEIFGDFWRFFDISKWFAALSHYEAWSNLSQNDKCMTLFSVITVPKFTLLNGWVKIHGHLNSVKQTAKNEAIGLRDYFVINALRLNFR